MHHEDLRALGLAFGQIRDALAVRRPDRIAALGEEAVMLPVGTHDPYRSLKIVSLLVDHRSRVDDLRAVGRHLGRARRLQIQIPPDGEPRLIRICGMDARSRAKQHQQSQCRACQCRACNRPNIENHGTPYFYATSAGSHRLIAR